MSDFAVLTGFAISNDKEVQRLGFNGLPTHGLLRHLGRHRRSKILAEVWNLHFHLLLVILQGSLIFAPLAVMLGVPRETCQVGGQQVLHSPSGRCTAGRLNAIKESHDLLMCL